MRLCTSAPVRGAYSASQGRDEPGTHWLAVSRCSLDMPILPVAGPSRIESLPLPTQSQLRSTQILTSLPQLISELVQNALDAAAHHIDIGVDCDEWECWVRDDGTGMSKDGLKKLVGGMSPAERRYSESSLASAISSLTVYTVHASDSSKAYTPASLDEVSTFGFRGEGRCLPSGRQDPINSLTTRFIALASAADVSCLEISSRTARSRESWSIILKAGECLYEGPSIRWRRESRGTVVSVRDAFYNVSPTSFPCDSAFLNLPIASNPSALSPIPSKDHRDN